MVERGADVMIMSMFDSTVDKVVGGVMDSDSGGARTTDAER